MSIIRNETPLALYTGLGAVLSGIVPKMAIRFSSFETYRKWLMDNNTGEISTAKTFLGQYILYYQLVEVITDGFWQLDLAQVLLKLSQS